MPCRFRNTSVPAPQGIRKALELTKKRPRELRAAKWREEKPQGERKENRTEQINYSSDNVIPENMSGETLDRPVHNS